MAASNQKNDLVQIVMLTFFLCTVFFTGLGIWYSMKVKGLTEDRGRLVRGLAGMERDFLKKDNIQIVKDERARQKSAENSGQIDTAVNSVLANSSLKINDLDSGDYKLVTSGPDKFREYSYNATFDGAPIGEVLRFLGMLEAQQPHLECKKMKLKSKKRKPEDPDLWELNLSLITYTPDS